MLTCAIHVLLQVFDHNRRLVLTGSGAQLKQRVASLVAVWSINVLHNYVSDRGVGVDIRESVVDSKDFGVKLLRNLVLR